jgi:hypothetical protein
MNKRQRLPKHERISKTRYIKPSSNKIQKKYLNHKKGKANSQGNLKKKIRDVKRLIAYSEKTGAAELLAAQREKLSTLLKQKKNKRAERFLHKQYKNVKFYGKIGVKCRNEEIEEADEETGPGGSRVCGACARNPGENGLHQCKRRVMVSSTRKGASTSAF